MSACIALRVCLCYCCIGLRSSFYHFRYRFWCRGLFRGWSLRQLGIRVRFRGVPRWVLRLDLVAFTLLMFLESCETFDTVFMILSFEILWYSFIFRRLRAHMLLLRTWDYVYLSYMMFCSREQFLEKVYPKNFESYFLLYYIWFEKLSKEFSIIKIWIETHRRFKCLSVNHT